MSGLMHVLVENYNEVLESKKDSVVDTWLFMNSPVPIVSIVVLYLYFVLKLGPQLMEKRPPFTLKTLLMAYNGYQVIFSLWMCNVALQVDNGFQMMFKQCNSLSSDSAAAIALSSGAWWYFFSKVIDLLDTVFFVLRKKQSQVTFLHVYHHSVMVLFTWAYLKYLPGEQGVIIGIVNSAVHAVMYSYYFIAALGPQYQKYLWWKKYMTVMQLTQFCIILAYLVTVIAMDCKMPKALTFFFVGNVIVFLYLFLDFYRKEYRKRSQTNGVENKKTNKLD